MATKQNKKYNKAIAISLILVIVLVIVDLAIKYIPWKNLFEKEIITTNKTDVTIQDTGIAESVNKLYDATVIVKVGIKNSYGWGSGVIYDTDDEYGYLLTNNHVVEDASSIKIIFTDETEVDGTLVGTDVISDIAVVKIPKSYVKAVCTQGESEKVRLGDTSFAIGTPISLTYSFTITRGIISGKNRLVEMTSAKDDIFGTYNAESWYMNLIQTDAPVNSGNSGGPLANANGDVIGIINSKLSSSTSKSSSIESMGFAIPIEDAMNVASQLRKNGKVVRPILGVSMKVPNPYATSTTEEEGAEIAEIVPGSSADEAGIKSGDIIVKFGDYKVTNYKYLKYYLYRYNVGDQVEVTYKRGGQEKTTTITLRES